MLASFNKYFTTVCLFPGQDNYSASLAKQGVLEESGALWQKSHVTLAIIAQIHFLARMAKHRILYAISRLELFTTRGDVRSGPCVMVLITTFESWLIRCLAWGSSFKHRIDFRMITGRYYA